jgi:hypothetical protein
MLGSYEAKKLIIIGCKAGVSERYSGFTFQNWEKVFIK